jgi:hypothetical protein
MSRAKEHSLIGICGKPGGKAAEAGSVQQARGGGGGNFDVFGVPSTLINDRTGYKNICSHVQDDFKSLQSLPRRTSS